MAKPATWRVRPSSVRRTWRNFARNGETSGPRFTLRLLDAGDLLQRGDPFLDRRVGGGEAGAEDDVKVLWGFGDHNGDPPAVHHGRRVRLGDLLQRRYSPAPGARD